MYKQIGRSKENKSSTITTSGTQNKDGGRRCFGFIDNRLDAVYQRRLQNTVNVNSPAIQCKDIHDTVFYGHAQARSPYLATDRSVDHSMPHLTVDTLNHAVGLTNVSMGGLMGDKRNTVLEVTNGRQGNISQDEQRWVEWLRERQEPLLMPSMNGKQCREDRNMDNSWWATIARIFNSPTRHKIHGNNGNIWQQEKHRNNVEDGIEQQDNMPWTDSSRIAHNNYVSGVDGDEPDLFNGMDEVMPDGMAERVAEQTNQWLSRNVMYSFWRLTSKMGLDFFANQGKHVAFIRGQGQLDHVGDGRRAITDSEWEHANRQGYIKNQSVSRHEPL